MKDENALNRCRHCNDVIETGKVAFRLSSWWLLCRQCYNDIHMVTITEMNGELLLTDGWR